MQELLPFCETDRQREVLQAVIDHGTINGAAKSLGADRRSLTRMVRRIEKLAAKKGYSPSHDFTRPVPDGFKLKRHSQYYDKEGKPSQKWVIATPDQERQAEIMREAVAAMAEEITPLPSREVSLQADSDLLNLYVITDYHFGMLSWPDETGAAWDVDLAEETIVAWFKRAIELSPQAETGLFAQLGDFLHFDGYEALTPASKHLLDADSRFPRLVRAAVRISRHVIEMLLDKHPKVHVIWADANHDPASSVWMREWLAALYAQEPRVTIDTSPDTYYCYEHGRTSLFFHHGHKRKLDRLDEVLAAKFRDVFGRTDHSYAHTGHLHHKEVKETGLMVIEQHRTLAAPDAYASRGGYMSGRDAQVITYHKRHGQVGSHTISYQMVSGEPQASS